MLKTHDFYYDLPEELIAQTPLERRDASRLMTLDRKTGEVTHRHFYDLLELLQPGDCLVMNNSRVLPARLLGHRVPTGGAVEVLLLRDKGDGEAEPDEDQYTYTGHVLELDDAVRTAVLLELPSRILCKEDCRGLCAQCGANLNVNACSCQKDLTSRNPFSALASLLNEDEEV